MTQFTLICQRKQAGTDMTEVFQSYSYEQLFLFKLSILKKEYIYARFVAQW